MNPLEKGYAPKKIVQVKKALSWKPYTLQLVGTGGLKAQQNFAADYDFVSKIDKFTTESAFDSIDRILQNINDTPNLFFIELKLQNKDGSKIKIFKIEDFNEQSFNVAFDPEEIDYAKIDGVVDLDGAFKEVSALYFLSSTPLDNAKYQGELLKDAKEKYDDGKPYKALKRMFMAEKLQDRLGHAVNIDLINNITDFFNSEVGKLYERMNQIDAALIFHEKYSGPTDMRRLDRFISNIGLAGINVLQLPQISKEYNKIIQREALKFFKKHKLTPGKLPGSMSGGLRLPGEMRLQHPMLKLPVPKGAGNMVGGYDSVLGSILTALPGGIYSLAKSGVSAAVNEGKKSLAQAGDDKLRDLGLHMANKFITNIGKSQRRADKAKAKAAAAAPTGGKRRCRGGAARRVPMTIAGITEMLQFIVDNHHRIPQLLTPAQLGQIQFLLQINGINADNIQGLYQQYHEAFVQLSDPSVGIHSAAAERQNDPKGGSALSRWEDKMGKNMMHHKFF